MDRLDTSLMKALLTNNGVPPGIPTLRKSFRSLARELGVDQGTIRTRMRRFQERGLLRNWYLGVNPRLTGLSVTNLWIALSPQDDKHRVADRLSTVDGVERTCLYYGPKLSVVLTYKGSRELKASLRRVRAAVGPGDTVTGGEPDVSPLRPLSTTDLEIVRVLGRDPWMPFAAVAKETRLSPRTVKRRVSALSESGAIYMLPDLDLRTLHGVVPAELVVSYESGAQASAVNERIASRIREHLIFSRVSKSFAYFALNLPNVSMVEALTRWAGKQQGVRDVHSDIIQEVVLNRRYYSAMQAIPKKEPLKERLPEVA